MKKIIVIIAVAVLLQLMFVPASFAAPPSWGGQNNCGNTCYTVQYGDTLFSIGRRFGIYPYDIARANGLYDPDYIYAGQVLYIPPGRVWYQSGYGYGGNQSGGGYGGYQSGYGCGGNQSGGGCGGYQPGYGGYQPGYGNGDDYSGGSSY